MNKYVKQTLSSLIYYTYCCPVFLHSEPEVNKKCHIYLTEARPLLILDVGFFEEILNGLCGISEQELHQGFVEGAAGLQGWQHVSLHAPQINSTISTYTYLQSHYITMTQFQYI